MAVLSRLRLAAPLRLGLLSGSRAYGSSAAAQLQYDYDDDDEWKSHRDRRPAMMMENSEESVSGRGVQWVIIGDPIAKRHVYAERLSNLLDVPHISMRTLVRQELHPHSSLYQEIADAVNHGKLVPEDVIFSLLSKRLEEGYCRGETGFILDGIPRTRIQAEILDQIADIDLVVNFKCTEECLIKHLGSGVCSTCSRGSSGLNPNMQLQDDQMKCSSAGAEGAWKEKLHIYAEQSKPVEDYYRKQKKLLDFHVGAAPGETWQGLLAALHLQHMNAVSYSQKLTA